MGIPGTDQLPRRHENQGIGPLQPVHGGAEGILHAGGGKPLPGHDVGNGLGVAGGVENSPGQLQLIPEAVGIAQVTVVGDGHASLLMVDLNRLAVAPYGGPCGAVACMTHGHGPLGQAVQGVNGKHLAHQSHILAGGKHPIVIDHYSAALLSPVLEGVQSIVDDTAYLCRLRRNNTKNAAFFMDTHISSPCDKHSQA